jgi:hypothetical protein
MDFNLLLSNLGNPTLLFFVLGILAATLKSDLEIPAATSKFISYYLLLAIGFKGGQELSHSEVNTELVLTLLGAVTLSAIIPIVVFFVLRRRLPVWDAGAIAAAFGSVSAVTFVAATNFLESKGIAYGGHMVAAMALMESPAIIIGVILVRLYDRSGESSQTSLSGIIRHSFTNGSVLLILGSLLIGLLSDAKQAEGIKPFTTDIFKGFLSVFLLDMGMITARRFAAFRSKGLTLAIFGLLFPLTFGSLTAWSSHWISHETGNRFLLSILAASASYIAVPAAMRMAVPKSDPGLYIPMALGITFPFNLTLGMMMYYNIIVHS